MQYSRTGIIAVLAAAELFIAGAIVWTVAGKAGFTAQAAGLHRLSYAPQTYAPIDGGASPSVTVDDPDSRVVVTVSDDGRVHVTDATRLDGWVFGRSQPTHLRVEQTAVGVRITRPQKAPGFQFQIAGFVQQRIEVALPAASLVEVTRCAGAELSDLIGTVRVHSVDGSISARNLHNNAELVSDDGRIEAGGIRADRLSVSTHDGRLVLDDVAVNNLDGSTNDGSIRARAIAANGGSLHTGDGPITLSFAGTPNLLLRAHTNNGRVIVNGASTRAEGDSAEGSYPLGAGAGAFDATTQDGTIRITTNGAQ